MVFRRADRLAVGMQVRLNGLITDVLARQDVGDRIRITYSDEKTTFIQQLEIYPDDLIELVTPS